MCMARFVTLLLAMVFCIVFPSEISAQEAELPVTIIEGRVSFISKNDPAVCFVIVYRMSDKAAMAYAATDKDGNYSVRFSTGADSVIVSVSGMGVKTASKIVPNMPSRLDFKVEEDVFNLKEALIKAEKIKMSGDTLSYNVASFRSREDLVIEDVLKKMPGVTVSRNGTILYKQKPVKAVMIDGMDLLKGRYGIATRNISPDHIATVEILENHQVVKALRNLVPSDDTYLNLKLKTSSKGVFLISGVAGGGYDGKGLWNAEVAGMYFGHSSQHIITGKTNNTGNDLRYELMDHNGGLHSLGMTLASPTLASPPAISKDKYYFNTSYSASVNELFRTKNGDDVNVNVSYFNDSEIRTTMSETRWMLPDSSVNVIGEDIRNRIAMQKIDAEIGYVSNRNKNYVQNHNFFSGEFSDAVSHVNGLRQNFRLSSIKAASTLSMIKRFSEDNAYELNAKVIYEHKPYFLQVERDTGAVSGSRFSGALQNVSSDGLEASVFMAGMVKKRLWGITFSPTLGTVYNMDLLDSGLELPQAAVLDGIPVANDLMMHRLRVAPAVRASYNSMRFDVEVFLPVAYHFTSLRNPGFASMDRHKVFVEPTLEIKFRPSASMDLDFGYSLSYSMPDFSVLYEGAILRDYKSLTRYTADLTEGISNFFSLSLGYKDVLNMFFLNIKTSYSLSLPRILYGYYFDGIYSSSITHRTGELSHVLSAGAELSKGIYWKNLNIKMALGASYGDMPYLRQEQVVRMESQAYQVSAGFSFSPFDFLGVEYDGNLLCSLVSQGSGENLEPLLTNSNQLKLAFRIPGGVGLELIGDHYYNNASSGRKSFVLFDAGITYSYKKLRWVLSCSNLLDTRNYVYSVLSAGSSFRTDYLIRPRAFLLKMYVTF